MKRWFGLLMASAFAFGDVGVLLPGDKTEPDASILALDEMAIKVTIFNGHAKVNIRQVFANRRKRRVVGNLVQGCDKLLQVRV